MKVLLCSATDVELNSLYKAMGLSPHQKQFNQNGKLFHVLNTGVGMVSTAFTLGKHLANHSYDLAINFGLAGSFNSSISLGEVVNVYCDSFSELGAEDDKNFISLEEMGLMTESVFPFKNGNIEAISDPNVIKKINLKKAKGITVNTVHGNQQSIEAIKKAFNPDIESMEGAAFLYACRMEGLSCIQLRAISNRVELRNKAAWEIDLALMNLSKELKTVIDNLSK